MREIIIKKMKDVVKKMESFEISLHQADIEMNLLEELFILANSNNKNINLKQELYSQI